MRYKNKSLLTNLNILRFIKERNKLLVSFLCGVSGWEFSVESEQIQYALASTLDVLLPSEFKLGFTALFSWKSGSITNIWFQICFCC